MQKKRTIFILILAIVFLCSFSGAAFNCIIKKMNDDTSNANLPLQIEIDKQASFKHFEETVIYNEGMEEYEF